MNSSWLIVLSLLIITSNSISANAANLFCANKSTEVGTIIGKLREGFKNRENQKFQPSLTFNKDFSLPIVHDPITGRSTKKPVEIYDPNDEFAFTIKARNDPEGKFSLGDIKIKTNHKVNAKQYKFRAIYRTPYWRMQFYNEYFIIEISTSSNTSINRLQEFLMKHGLKSNFYLPLDHASCQPPPQADFPPLVFSANDHQLTDDENAGAAADDRVWDRSRDHSNKDKFGYQTEATDGYTVEI